LDVGAVYAGIERVRGEGGRYTEIQFCLWSTGFEFKLDIDKNM